ncbi:hypothetical protein J5Y09_06790 [Roseomonas sp. PWR1]|uniref:Uncharacterized protein n=1 Tax=Roseomonas nitratireducens TaxID=2820810 RepID=A0ABS4AQI1_9PROT|nr:hypothetical protein [Neoroseomonas nitratireducens]MBP0463610.1 hypothetical protein [Neoroseomonas nitratireducens]
MPAPVTFKDLEYASLAAAARAHGLNAATVINRVRRGWSVAQALATPPIAHGRPVKVGAATYGSRAQAISAFGVAERTLYARMERGISLPDALALGKQPRGPRPGTVRTTALAAGADPVIVAARLRSGWSLARALAVPAKRYRRRQTPKG